MDFCAYLQVWMDVGLDYKELKLCKNITVDYSMLKTQLWNPNTCIVNTKFARIHKSPQENTFVQIYDNGTVSLFGMTVPPSIFPTLCFQARCGRMHVCESPDLAP